MTVTEPAIVLVVVLVLETTDDETENEGNAGISYTGPPRDKNIRNTSAK